MRIRPIVHADIEDLLQIARETGVGFTSLPDNREFLEAKLAHTRATFERHSHGAAPSAADEPELYFFVLEDDSPEGANRIAGCCAIEARVGLDTPFYNYRVGRMSHSSVQLGLHRTIDTLFLSSDHTGDAEVCSLYLRPEYRRDRNGVLLSKSRWLFMASFRALFPERVLAEMRGVFDEQHQSPFWECLGRHFFPMDFRDADRLTGLGQKSFIGELMPKFPIYTPFLSEAARACIGQVHEHTRPALAMLKKEGLRWEGYIDIFDGGPTVESYLDDVLAVRDSRTVTIDIAEGLPSEERTSWLAATFKAPDDFRAAWVGRAPTGDILMVTPEEARRLGAVSGEPLRILSA
ncbi:arginine N-succinyltransferase [Phytohalomonas tamaricis]|uniref:arginine N-succinyltransferase n=1 Tax=Phytohalomonas tamaricis TaxID=2081032 RepID=UPI000D0BDC89|nr:arginine N-succinyltransferase [Phytohalomonas tamaricis]